MHEFPPGLELILQNNGWVIPQPETDSAILYLRLIRQTIREGRLDEARSSLLQNLQSRKRDSAPLLDLLFTDPVLIELITAGDKTGDALLDRAAQIIQGKFKDATLIKGLDRLDKRLLPLAALKLVHDGTTVDSNILQQRDDSDHPFNCFATSLLDLAAGKILPAVQSIFTGPLNSLGTLLLTFAAEQTGDERWLELLLAETNPDDDTFSVRLARACALIATKKPILHKTISLNGINLSLPRQLRQQTAESIARRNLENMLDRSDRLLDLGLDEAATVLLRDLFNTHRDDPEVLLKLSEVQERAGNHLQACKILTFLEKEAPAEIELKRRLFGNLKIIGQQSRALAKLDELLKLTPEDTSALAAGMELALELDDDARSLVYANRLVKLNPAHLEGQRTIARAAAGDERERAWMTCLKISPEDPEARRELKRLRYDEKNKASRELVTQARQEIEKGDTHRAEHLLRELIDVDPHCTPAWFDLAELLESIRRLDDALSVLKQGACTDGGWQHPRLRSEAGRLALRLHRRRDALEILSELRVRRPEDWESRHRYLVVQREQAYRGELETTAPELLEQLNQDPGTADGFADFERGYILQFFPRFQRTEKWESGLLLMDKTRRARPDLTFLWDDTLRGLLIEDRHTEAFKLLQLMQQRDLDPLRGIQQMIRYLLDVQEPIPEELVRQLRALNPDDIMLGEILQRECSPYLGESELVKASDYVRRIRRECQTDDPQDLLRLGFTCVELADAARLTGDPVSQSVDAFKQLLAMKEDHQAALSGLTQIAISAQELLPDVQRHLDLALTRHPDDAVLHALRGDLLDRGCAADKKDEAARCFEESLRLDFDQPKIHQALASIRRYQRDHALATHHYMISLDISKSKALKDEAVRALNWLRRAEKS